MDTELFRNVVPFVAVAEARSFRRAAATLGVSAAAVSKAVRALEEGLGVALLARGPRAVTLTREGELFFERAQQAVASVAGARRDVAAMRSVAHGELHVSAPFITSSLLAPALALLRARHPRLTIRLSFTDRLSRLAEESVDVAVRVGPLADSALVARRLRATEIVTVASPTYLARRGRPLRVEDLPHHDCVAWIAPGGRARRWRFASGEREVVAATVSDHGPALLDAALAGLGVTQVLDYMAEGPLRDGDLVTVLDDERAAGPDIHALCAPGQRASARVRAAFDAFTDAFARGASGPSALSRG